MCLFDGAFRFRQQREKWVLHKVRGCSILGMMLDGKDVLSYWQRVCVHPWLWFDMCLRICASVVMFWCASVVMSAHNSQHTTFFCASVVMFWYVFEDLCLSRHDLCVRVFVCLCASVVLFWYVFEDLCLSRHIYAYVCVCVCVREWVSERERERERESVCVCASVVVFWYVFRICVCHVCRFFCGRYVLMYR